MGIFSKFLQSTVLSFSTIQTAFCPHFLGDAVLELVRFPSQSNALLFFQGSEEGGKGYFGCLGAIIPSLCPRAVAAIVTPGSPM